MTKPKTRTVPDNGTNMYDTLDTLGIISKEQLINALVYLLKPYPAATQTEAVTTLIVAVRNARQKNVHIQQSQLENLRTELDKAQAEHMDFEDHIRKCIDGQLKY